MVFSRFSFHCSSSTHRGSYSRIGVFRMRKRLFFFFFLSFEIMLAVDKHVFTSSSTSPSASFGYRFTGRRLVGLKNRARDRPVPVMARRVQNRIIDLISLRVRPSRQTHFLRGIAVSDLHKKKLNIYIYRMYWKMGSYRCGTDDAAFATFVMSCTQSCIRIIHRS